MKTGDSELLPDGVAVPFSKIDRALSQGPAGRLPRLPDRALTATVVATGPAGRLYEAAETLRALGREGGVRAIVITDDPGADGRIRVAENTVHLPVVKSRFVNNAVAALRLSSLPTLVWWRGGPIEPLDELATLADRLVLDAEDPAAAWRGAVDLVSRTALSDLHWTRLTRWRTLMAHFFDVPDVREAAQSFTALDISGSDLVGAKLFATWLLDSLDLAGRVAVTLTPVANAPLASIRFGDSGQALTLRLAPSGTCVETAAIVSGHRAASRIVTLGDQGLPALLREELRIRSRDAAFERTLRAVVDES